MYSSAMRAYGRGEVDLREIPAAFCWTKMGAEAGQPLTGILQRKELERAAGGGIFAWGIGSSLGSGLKRLLQSNRAPSVIFSEMKAKPRAMDAKPQAIVLWLSYVSPDGDINPLPEHVVVTSRATLAGGKPKGRHYALFCDSDAPLYQDPGGEIYFGQLRNLDSGKPLGFSQVTSVVQRYELDPASGPRYPITFRARLAWPYFARLANPVRLSEKRVLELEKFSGTDSKRDADEWRHWAVATRNEAMRSVIHDRNPGNQLSLSV
jgi:hypothetical protein